MDFFREPERREFIRTKVVLPVKYKFLCHYRQDAELGNVYDGKTHNISSKGLLLEGRIPNFDWLPELLMHKMAVGMNIMIPNQANPVKALGRIVWIETIDQQTLSCKVGIQFREISKEHEDMIVKYVIHCQMPSEK